MLALAICQVLAAAPTVQEFTLGNGLRVVLRHDDSTPLVSVNLWVRAGSASEEPGRTGLAHLFEHLMFKGTRRIPDGMLDRLLEEAGGMANATASEDRTSYYVTLPANFLELALWIEGDRMATMAPGLSQEALDNQRDVVRNERRQRIENVPYGTAERHIREALYPDGHPYRSLVFGSHEDLQAATLADARAFFRRFYAPNNMTLVLAGNLPVRVRALVERYLGGLARGPEVTPPVAPGLRLGGERRIEIRDRVQLARVYVVWSSPPFYAPGDAEMDLVAGVLAGGKSSRLYRRLVYEKRVAQDVEAAQVSARLGSMFQIVVTAKPGRSPADLLAQIDDELRALRFSAPSWRELGRARNRILGGIFRELDHLEAVADLTNRYLYYLGQPDALERDLDRYRRATPEAVRDTAAQVLGPDRVVLTVLPQ